MSSKYTFKNFTELTDEESSEVLRGRNNPAVRCWMVSDRIIGTDEHQRFIARLRKSPAEVYLRVERLGRFAGVYSVSAIKDGVGLGGFWVTDEIRERFLSLCVVFHSIGYAFATLSIKEIWGFQLLENHSASRLNSMLGFHLANRPPDADPRMAYWFLTRDSWLMSASRNPKLLRLIELAESRNEN